MPKVSGHGYAFQGYASSNFSENKEKWASVLMEKYKGQWDIPITDKVIF